MGTWEKRKEYLEAKRRRRQAWRQNNQERSLALPNFEDLIANYQAESVYGNAENKPQENVPGASVQEPTALETAEKTTEANNLAAAVAPDAEQSQPVAEGPINVSEDTEEQIKTDDAEFQETATKLAEMGGLKSRNDLDAFLENTKPIDASAVQEQLYKYDQENRNVVESPEDVDKSKNALGFGEFAEKITPYVASGLNTITNAGAGILAATGKVDSDSTYSAQMGIGNALINTGNPYGVATGLIWNGASTIAQAAGMNMNFLNKRQGQSLGMNTAERWANNIVGLMPGGRTLFGTTDRMDNYDFLRPKLGGSMSGALYDMQLAQNMSGKGYLNKGKMNSFIRPMSTAGQSLMELEKYNSMRRNSDFAPSLTMQNQEKLAGGYGTLYSSKNGSKLPTLEEAKILIAKQGAKVKKEMTEDDLFDIFLRCEYMLYGDVSKYTDKTINYSKTIQKELKNLIRIITSFSDDILNLFNHDINFLDDLETLLDIDPSIASEQEIKGSVLPIRDFLAAYFQFAPSIDAFQNGGSIMNPAGALHAHLNHMEDANEEVGSVVTQKGIPVVTTDEEGKLSQVAEIERDEIIFSLELTKEIEKLWHEGTEEAMIKAGKLIAEALIEDSTDNTGLFEKTE